MKLSTAGIGAAVLLSVALPVTITSLVSANVGGACSETGIVGTLTNFNGAHIADWKVTDTSGTVLANGRVSFSGQAIVPVSLPGVPVNAPVIFSAVWGPDPVNAGKVSTVARCVSVPPQGTTTAPVSIAPTVTTVGTVPTPPVETVPTAPVPPKMPGKKHTCRTLPKGAGPVWKKKLKCAPVVRRCPKGFRLVTVRPSQGPARKVCIAIPGSGGSVSVVG